MISHVVVMGVSGSGKSTVGEELARALGEPFLDADALHPASNIEKMAAGIPLADEDRWPWLDRVAAELQAAADAGTGLVVACSALRRAYRDRIREGAASAFFVELHGSTELLRERLAARSGHFMPLQLLGSQLATLESLAPDEDGILIDISASPHEIVETAVAALTHRETRK